MWINPETNEVAYTNMQVREMRPNWSAPIEPTDDMVRDQGFVEVVEVAPSYDPLKQVATELLPVLVDGAWTQQWEITDLSAEQIEANLGEAIRAKNDEINRARLQANASTFPYLDKQIAVDTVSFNDIISTNGYVALFGEFAEDWPGGWKTVDNSYVEIKTVDEWKAFYKAMVSKGNANFKLAQGLKARLALATTAEEIGTIRWPGVSN